MPLIRLGIVLLLALGPFACRTAPRAEAANPLAMTAESVEALDSALRDRISESPHALFRFVNVPFAREVCRRIDAVLPSLPTVNLHGDAHLEQIAVIGESAGLMDFDDSASGPPILDLARFGVSVELTMSQRGWTAESSSVARHFLQAYRSGLESTTPPPTPACVKRLASRAAASPTAFLEWAESLMGPKPAQAQAEVERGFGRYVDLMLDIHPDLNAEFFRLKRWGMLSGGIGSATTLRYLARIEGPSAAADDDIILEAKELRDLSGVPCIVAQRGNALRVVAGSVRFGRSPDPYLAAIPRGADEEPDDPPWWMQSWDAGYREFDILSSLESSDELVELVETVGFQMAQGHTNILPPPYDQQLRKLVVGMLDERQGDIEAMIHELSGLVIAAHAELVATP